MMNKTEFKFTAQGRELDVSEASFGMLRESTDVKDHVEELQNRLEDDGYLFIRDFYDPEVVKAAQNRLVEELNVGGYLDPNFPLKERRVRQNGDGSKIEIPMMPHLHNEEAIQNYLYGPRVIQFFEKLLGGGIRHYDYTWLRGISRGHATNPHADIVYMGRGTPKVYTTWVPYFDVPFELGGLIVLEGSHKPVQQERLKQYLSLDVDEYCTNRQHAEAIESGERVWEHSLGGALSNNPVTTREKLGGRWLTEEFKAGDVMIFGMHLIHGSLDNHTDQVRVSSDSRYQLASNAVDERWVGPNPAGHSLSGKKGRIC